MVGLGQYGFGVDQPANVVDIASIDADHTAPGNGACVVQAAREIEVYAVACQQAAFRRQVTGTRAQINLRGEHALAAAVSQRNFFGDQPDDVAGERRDLQRRQGNTRDKVPVLSHGDACIHQGLVLRFIIGKAV